MRIIQSDAVPVAIEHDIAGNIEGHDNRTTVVVEGHEAGLRFEVVECYDGDATITGTVTLTWEEVAAMAIAGSAS